MKFPIFSDFSSKSLVLTPNIARRQLGIFDDFYYVNEDTPSFKMSPINLLLQFVLGQAFSGVYRLDK